MTMPPLPPGTSATTAKEKRYLVKEAGADFVHIVAVHKLEKIVRILTEDEKEILRVVDTGDNFFVVKDGEMDKGETVDYDYASDLQTAIGFLSDNAKAAPRKIWELA